MEKITQQKYPDYKDSGVEWLGEIPDHWEVTRVKNVFRLVIDPAPKNNDCELLSVYTDIGVKPRAELEERGNKASTTDGYWFVKKGDIVVNKLLAWMGAIGVSNYNGVTSPAYDILRARVPLDSNYFHYLFRNEACVSELKKHSRGIMDMRLRLYFDKFGDITIPFPDYSEQQKIVSFLDRKTALIDKAIGIKEKQIELLKERRQILIHRAVTRGLNPDVKLKDSGVEWIGEIPEHWEVKRLKEICKAFGRIGFRGYTTADLVNEGEGAITISPSNIKEEFMTFEKCSFLSWDKYYQSPEIQIFEDDILMVKTGSTFGKIGIVKNLIQSATINPQLLVLKDIKINSEYFYVLMKTSVVQYQVQTEVIGSTIPTISETKILNFKVVLPPNIEIDGIMFFIENVKSKIATAISLKEQEIEKLKEYKASLINEVVTGKVKVC